MSDHTLGEYYPDDKLDKLIQRATESEPEGEDRREECALVDRLIKRTLDLIQSDYIASPPTGVLGHVAFMEEQQHKFAHTFFSLGRQFERNLAGGSPDDNWPSDFSIDDFKQPK